MNQKEIWEALVDGDTIFYDRSIYKLQDGMLYQKVNSPEYSWQDSDCNFRNLPEDSSIGIVQKDINIQYRNYLEYNRLTNEYKISVCYNGIIDSINPSNNPDILWIKWIGDWKIEVVGGMEFSEL